VHPRVVRKGHVKAPAGLSAAEQSMFRGVARQLETTDLGFCQLDAQALGLVVVSFRMAVAASRPYGAAGTVIHDGKNDRDMRHPGGPESRQWIATFLAGAKEFGMTPVSRLRLNLAVEDEPDDGEGLFDT
jgi:phage terminase small subunit